MTHLIEGEGNGSQAEIEVELRALERRKKLLSAKRGDAAVGHAAAQDHRRQLLIETEDTDETSLAKAEAVVQCRADEVRGLDDAIAEIDRRLAAAQVRLTEARDQQTREKSAGDREAAADQIAEAAEQLDRGLKIVAEAFDTIIGAIPHDVPRVLGLDGFVVGPPLNGVEIARGIFAEGLFHVAPSTFALLTQTLTGARYMRLSLRVRRASGVDADVSRTDELEIGDARAAARALLVDPLRQQARQIRAGMSLGLKTEVNARE